MSASGLYLPSPEDLDGGPQLERWYGNVEVELSCSALPSDLCRKMADYYLEAGLLRPWRKPFFLNHYGGSFRRASAFLLDGLPTPRILDLGCGTGTQTLYLALRGASVAALDMDLEALDMLRWRKALYERELGKALEIDVVPGNAHDVDFRTLGPFDGVYSMFAFNMMQPSDMLLERLWPHLAPGARIAIIDGNNASVWGRILPWRRRQVLSPASLAQRLSRRGAVLIEHAGAAALPPVFWAALPSHLVRPLDRLLGRNWLFPVSHQILAAKGGGARGAGRR